ncbi:alternate-type signal peptide domain-containing protein [Aeromicrobium terrae]|uniref:Alternate-type signal peptide domain-containing protein n=1 Tax=Aeromicrobium terrae TaxID=2498846 RepID=A0A5C8NP31_9ACTN|nr:alternate-type signal peptide domain-containing protein [Aeromicrobium terrae]TXL62946.1 alternate-type signal peptide domain-containing protein [Aeromicrobium terrae]
MKKSTKGAAAAATAGILLLGGAGTLAFWTDSLTVGGGSISSGHLSLDDTTGDDNVCANAPWILDDDEDPMGAEFNPATDKIVPGDVLTKTCTFTVNAVGTHLRATLGTTGGQEGGATDLNAEASVDASFTVGGDSGVTEITDQNDNETVVATITLTFPYGVEDNDSQDDTLTISDYTVTATQVHNS